MLNEDKESPTIEVTIKGGYLVLIAVGFILAYFAVPTHQAKIQELTDKIQRLNDKIVIYEFNKTESIAVSTLLNVKNKEIKKMKAVHDNYINKTDRLINSVNLLTDENIQLQRKIKQSTKDNQKLKDLIAIQNKDLIAMQNKSMNNEN